MRSNPENLLRILQNDLKLLLALKQTGPLKFTEIHRQTKSSQRTVAKHLKSLVGGGNVEKSGRLYRITESGLESIRLIEDRLEKVQQHKKMAPMASFHQIRGSDVSEVQSTRPTGAFPRSKPTEVQEMENQQLAESSVKTSSVTDHTKEEPDHLEILKNNRSIGGPRGLDSTWNRFFLYISPEITHDQVLPFQLGTPLTLEIQQDCLVIRADDQERTHVPFVSPNSTAGWFKGTCRAKRI